MAIQSNAAEVLIVSDKIFFSDISC